MKNILLIITFLIFHVNLYSQMIYTHVGTGVPGHSGNGGLAKNAKIHSPTGCAFDKKGNFYFVEYQMHCIRKVDTNGVITTVAGNLLAGYNGDGIQATSARLNFPNSVAVDSSGNIYISDGNNCRIRFVDISNGIISTIAGDGTPGFAGDDGHATSAKLNYPGGICFDNFGNLIVSDPNNRRLRKIVLSTGIIKTIAGNGISGSSGDGGLATNAQITPGAVCVDADNNIYIADYTVGQSRVAKVNYVDGIISTLAGTVSGYVYNGDSMLATLANISPSGIAFDNSGHLYIADSYNNRVRKVSPTGYIYNIVGTGIAGSAGDSSNAILSQLNQPYNISFDFCGNLYITDKGNSKIRKVAISPFTIPTVDITFIGSNIVGSTITVNAVVSSVGSPYWIKWYKNSELFSTTTTPTTTFVKSSGIDTIIARVVPFSLSCYDSTTSAPHYVSDSSTSVRGVGVMGGVCVYPNPANKQVTIMAGERMRSVAISNMQGQELLRYVPNAISYTVAIDMLPPGLYMLRVNDVWVGKVVKE